MELTDAPSCFARLVAALWPCAIATVVVMACAAAFGACKRTLLLAAIIVFSVTTAMLWRRAVIQWRLALLESESPDANEAAYVQLNQNLTSAEIWPIIQSEREHPNVRFALAVILYERGGVSLLTSKPFSRLQRPAFFGGGTLAKAAQTFEFPLEAVEIPRRLTPPP